MLFERGPILAIVLLSVAPPAWSQEACPQLTHLYAEADEALTKAAGLAGQDRCNGYIRHSAAWADIAS
jgi:hypothetical protein